MSFKFEEPSAHRSRPAAPVHSPTPLTGAATQKRAGATLAAAPLLVVPFVTLILFTLDTLDRMAERHNSPYPIGEGAIAGTAGTRRGNGGSGRTLVVASASKAKDHEQQQRKSGGAVFNKRQLLSRLLQRIRSITRNAKERGTDVQKSVLLTGADTSPNDDDGMRKRKEEDSSENDSSEDAIIQIRDEIRSFQKQHFSKRSPSAGAHVVAGYSEDGSVIPHRHQHSPRDGNGPTTSEAYYRELYGPFSALGKYGDADVLSSSHDKIVYFTQAELRQMMDLPLVAETMPFGKGLIQLSDVAEAERRRSGRSALAGRFPPLPYDDAEGLHNIVPTVPLPRLAEATAAKEASDGSPRASSQIVDVSGPITNDVDATRPTTSDDATIFVSIAAFRDEYCRPTVESAFSFARFPERVFAGIVRQQEPTDTHRCIGDVYHTKDPKAGDSAVSCQLMSFCPTDNIRIRHNAPAEAKGPTYGRYVSMLMYQGEHFAMIIDSHTLFARGWDVLMIRDVWAARFSGSEIGVEADAVDGGGSKERKKIGGEEGEEASLLERLRGDPKTPHLRFAGGGKGAIISHYPTPFQEFRNSDRQQAGLFSSHMRTLMCNAAFQTGHQTKGLIRMIGHPAATQKDDKGRSTPRLQPFTAAGFLFGDAAYLLDVPFDPHLDFLFDGEEILYTARLWTHGYDSYAPSVGLLAHIYGRPKADRVWSVKDNLWWKHQALSHTRVHFLMRSYKYGLTSPPTVKAGSAGGTAAVVATRGGGSVNNAADASVVASQREARRKFLAQFKVKNILMQKKKLLAEAAAARNGSTVSGGGGGGAVTISDELIANVDAELRRLEAIANASSSRAASSSGDDSAKRGATVVTNDSHMLEADARAAAVAGKLIHAERYGMGPYRSIDDFYIFALTDRTTKAMPSTHCNPRVNDYFDSPGYSRVKLLKNSKSNGSV